MSHFPKLIFFLLLPGLSLAESSKMGDLTRLKEDLMGRSLEELVLLLGPPDKKADSHWYYGRSRVFFDNGLLVAFTGGQDLILRRTLRPQAERQIRKLKNFRQHGWVNAWTHSREDSEKELLEDIVE